MRGRAPARPRMAQDSRLPPPAQGPPPDHNPPEMAGVVLRSARCGPASGRRPSRGRRPCTKLRDRAPGWRRARGGATHSPAAQPPGMPHAILRKWGASGGGAAGVAARLAGRRSNERRVRTATHCRLAGGRGHRACTRHPWLPQSTRFHAPQSLSPLSSPAGGHRGARSACCCPGRLHVGHTRLRHRFLQRQGGRPVRGEGRGVGSGLLGAGRPSSALATSHRARLWPRPPSFYCPRYANPWDNTCGTYIQCYNAGASGILRTCQSGLVFSPQRQYWCDRGRRGMGG